MPLPLHQSIPDGMSEPTNSTVIDSATAYARWSAVARELVETLASCSACLRSKLARDVQHEDWQTVLDGVHQGITEVFMFAQQSSDVVGMAPARVSSVAASHALDHPLAQLARGYAAAFEAVGLVGLLLGSMSDAEIPSSAPEFIALGHRAAQALVPGLDLAFGRRRLGSVAQMCEHIGALENQADALFRSATALLLGPSGRLPEVVPTADRAVEEAEGAQQAAVRWTAHRATTLRLLVALEMLTDRCEDVADALLLVERLR